VNIRPLRDRVVVSLEPGGAGAGRHHHSRHRQRETAEAEVMRRPRQANDEGERSPMDVKAGDRILIGKYSGSEIKIDGQDYVILREDEILAVVG
jgi:chaperonin GroES